MNPLRFLIVAIALSTALFAEDTPSQADYVVSGPAELRQHVEPAKAVVDRFLAFYGQRNFKAANKLMWKQSGDVSHASDFQGRKFGKFQGRELNRVIVSDTYPPEADATFIIFHYTARFENKKALPQKAVVRVSEAGAYQIAFFP